MKPPPNPEMTAQRVSGQRNRPKWKWVWALALGLLAVPFGIILDEVCGDHAAFIGLAPYFLLSQYLFSRSNPQATRSDWPVVLALNAPRLIPVRQKPS